MKHFFTLLVAVIFFASCNCGDANEKTKKEVTAQEQVKKAEAHEHASAYVCPMHCEGSGDKVEGKCPKCDMDYVKNDKHHAHKTEADSTATKTKEEEHKHDHDHGDHGHTH